jgi:hypothetical protein
MFCIISLPRTSSTAAWHLFYSSLRMVNPASALHPLSSKYSAFNPRYLNSEQIENKFQEIIKSNPLPLIKIISNHDFNMIDRILDTDYKTVFIEPSNLKKQVLKVLVAKKTDTFVNKEKRNKFIGTIEISEPEILERFDYYKKHMMYQFKCDYLITDNMIQKTPNDVQNILNLPVIESKHRYEPFEITDEMMLKNMEDFHHLYDELSIKTFGELL